MMVLLPPEAGEVEERASLVKRSEMDFSWRRGGRMMWTSGSGHLGSWIEVTTEAARTWTGMDWVIVVSRSWGGRRKSGSGGRLDSVNESWADDLLAGVPAVVVVVVGMGGRREEVKVLVMMVRTRRGVLSCLVRRMEAEEPVRAERRARERRLRGTCRLMAFRGEADWMV